VEKNITDHIELIMRVPLANKNDLAGIRHWDNIKLALSNGFYWAKGFTAAQQQALELKILPQKSLYHWQGNQLFPVGSLLPSGHLPAGLLWTPIDKALPINSPALNHNFFGLQENVTIRLVSSEKENPAMAIMVNIAHLNQYIQDAPAVRLQHLSWALLPPTNALILGNPLLPIQGRTYWQCENMLLPTGYCFQWGILAKTIKSLIDPSNTHWICWHTDNTYSLMPKTTFTDLSIASFRLSLQFVNYPQTTVL
jgi:MoxR-vWA-beta-propeller ternary system domain bpX2